MNKFVPMRRILKTRRFAAIAALALLLLPSCHRQHYASRSDANAAKVKAQELTARMGINVTPQDDLKLYEGAAAWLGVPYRYGGTTRKGVDCSGFVNAVYIAVYSVKLQRSVDDIYSKDVKKVNRSQLREGDLVFFKLSNKNKPSHTGIYLKNGYFIHASTSRGVIISNLESEDYYRKGFIGGGQVRRR